MFAFRVFSTCLLALVPASRIPDPPQLSLEHFAAPIRKQLQEASDALRFSPQDALASGRLGMLLHALLRKNQSPIWCHAHTDGSYLSAHDSRVHFGLGSDPSFQAVLVQWLGGTREVFEGIKPNTIVTLRQREAVHRKSRLIKCLQYMPALPGTPLLVTLRRALYLGFSSSLSV